MKRIAAFFREKRIAALIRVSTWEITTGASSSELIALFSGQAQTSSFKVLIWLSI
jgi:hypothetical protein